MGRAETSSIERPAQQRSAARVVVTGMGAISALGVGVEALWQGLLDGRCGIGPLTRLDASRHRVGQAAEARDFESGEGAGHAIALATAAGAEAIHSAQLGEDELGRTALVLASNFGPMARMERLLSGDADAASARGFHDDALREVAERLAIGGFRSALSLSCASGNAAIGYAADLIRHGRANIALAGGYDALSEVVWAGLCSLRAMTDGVLRPFDRRRDGTVFGEGAGVLVLERADHAEERGAQPLAEFLGCATSSNAFHMTHPDPDGGGMVRAMRGALREANLAPESVDHVNAHATGTPPNDKLETMAIKTVFGERARRLPVNGIKSMIGHAMGAAGALEAIASIMTLRESVIPPTIGLEELDPECDLDCVPGAARRADVHTVLNNSAGFGGCNASVLFGRCE